MISAFIDRAWLLLNKQIGDRRRRFASCINPGGGVMDAVNEAQKLVRPRVG